MFIIPHTQGQGRPQTVILSVQNCAHAVSQRRVRSCRGQWPLRGMSSPAVLPRREALVVVQGAAVLGSLVLGPAAVAGWLATYLRLFTTEYSDGEGSR